MLFMTISPKTKTKQNKSRTKERGLQGVVRLLKVKLYIALYDSQCTKYCVN